MANKTRKPSKAGRTRKEVDPAFGRKLAELRLAKGWSQSQLAREAGVKVDTIQKWEIGRSLPMFLPMLAICRALGCDPMGFLGPETNISRIPKKIL